MGLDIFSSDDEKTFHISYFGFTKMRSYFVLHYGMDLFDDYNKLITDSIGFCFTEDYDRLFDNIVKNIDDLSILVEHSDCDGKLTSEECKKLKRCLFVDEEKIKSLLVEKEDFYNRTIKVMYEFIDIIDYCAEHDDIELIFC